MDLISKNYLKLVRNAFRKFRAGHISEDQLRLSLEEHLEALTDFTLEYDGIRSSMRPFFRDSVAQYEGHLFESKNNALACDYPGFIVEFRTALQIRSRLVLAIAQLRRYHTTHDALHALKSVIGSAWLNKLLSISIFDQLLNQVNGHLTNYEFEQAERLMAYCQSEIDSVQERHPTSEQPLRHLKTLQQLYKDTDSWATYCKDQPFPFDESIQASLLRLVENGNEKIVSQLLDDILLVNRSRQVFAKVLEDMARQNEQIPRQLVMQNLHEGNWIQASHSLLLNRSKGLLEKMDRSLLFMNSNPTL